MSDEQKKPVGDRIRALIEPALDDPRRPELQLKKLDEIFNMVSASMPRMLEQDFAQFEHHVERETGRKPENRNPLIIDSLTQVGRDGEALYQRMAGGSWKPVFDPQSNCRFRHSFHFPIG